MRKVKRRIITLLLALVIAAAAPLAVFAKPGIEPRTASQDGTMETALVAAKTLIDIDDDLFYDFNYSSSYSNYETREGLTWYFYWQAENAYIHACVTADGTLLNFYKYDYTGPSFGFAEIDKAEATAKADAFIKSANPDTHKYYKAPEEIRTNLHGSDYYLTYVAQVNGYAFPAANISVRVNKFTGAVSSYDTRNVNPERFKFESAENLISESAAVDAYADKIGLSLEYVGSYDHEERKITVFPAYHFNSMGDRYIGAVTGDVVEYVYDLGSDTGSNASGGSIAEAEAPIADAGSSDEQRGVNITPAERAAIEQAAGFIGSAQALAKLLETAGLTGLNVNSFDEQNVSLNNDYYEADKFYYNVNLYRYLEWETPDDEIAGVFGQVEAVTGRVISFNFYYHGTPMPDKVAMTDEQVDAAVEAFLKKYAPAELAKTKLDMRQSPVGDKTGYRSYNYFYNYVRYENDVPFRNNGIRVTFNQNTGKITSYSLSWFDKLTFPSVAGVLKPQQALAAFVEQNGSDIGYITAGEGNARLVYDFSSYALIDPFTGKAIDYSGKPGSDAIATPAYDDVAGHWSERYVKRLLDNGVYLWDGRFEPDKVMTELEFLQYIMLTEPSYYARMEPQAYFAQRGINVGASPDKPLTRQEAARIIVEYLGYTKLAGQQKWFVYPFSDKVAEEYKGYITICFMLGIVTGDANGRFNAAKNVTRGQAAAMLHNLILAQG